MLQQVKYSRHELEAMEHVTEPFRAQLPQGQMRMIDRIAHVSAEGGKYGRGMLVGEFDITRDLWFFGCHFPGDPIMPGSLGLEGLWQALGFYLAWSGYRGRGRALGVGQVKFLGEILPDAQLVEYHIHMKRIITRDMVLGLADGEVWVDGRCIYSAESLRAGFIAPPRSLSLA